MFGKCSMKTLLLVCVLLGGCTFKYKYNTEKCYHVCLAEAISRHTVHNKDYSRNEYAMKDLNLEDDVLVCSVVCH